MRQHEAKEMDKIRENSCVVLKGTTGMYDTLATPCHNTCAKGMPFETLNRSKSDDFAKVPPWKRENLSYAKLTCMMQH